MAGLYAAGRVAAGEAGQVGAHVEFDCAGFARGEFDAGEADQAFYGAGYGGYGVGEVELRDRDGGA